MDDETFMDCDTENISEVPVEQLNNIKKTKKHKRKRIRRLANTEKPETKTFTSGINCKHILITTTLITLTIGLFLGQYFTEKLSTDKMVKEFLKNYRNQYSEIVHGISNYCDHKQRLDTASIFARVKQHKILHQEQTLQQIEMALRNESDLKAVALVGPVGVGKTLFIRVFQQYFPWQENVHIYSWNTYVDDEAKKFHMIRIIIDNLSDCGLNLLVIENLQICDHGVVAIVNKLLIEANKKQHKRVVLFYIFSLNTMLNTDAYELQHKLLQSLPNCEVIYFKSFSELQLIDCIKREAEIEKVALTNKDYDEIVETIDPFKSGCKNVNAKILMYGTSDTTNLI